MSIFCEADVLGHVLGIISNLKFVPWIQNNAKPMASRMRSWCQDNVKPMSNQRRKWCQDECEADVKIMRSRCQGECEADVKMNAKPISRQCEADVKATAKPMSREMRSRCQDKCEADVKKALTDRHLHAQTSTPNGSTHKRIDARWKQADKYFPSMFALITSIPSISLS